MYLIHLSAAKIEREWLDYLFPWHFFSLSRLIFLDKRKRWSDPGQVTFYFRYFLPDICYFQQLLIHLLHQWTDLYSFDPPTSICACKMAFQKKKKKCKNSFGNGKESVASILPGWQDWTLTGNRTSSLEFPDHFWLTVTHLEVQTASVTLWRSWVAKEYSSGLSSNYQVAAKKKKFKNNFCAHGWPVEQMVQGEQTDEEEWRSDPSGNGNISQGSSALQSVLFSGSKCFRTC